MDPPNILQFNIKPDLSQTFNMVLNRNSRSHDQSNRQGCFVLLTPTSMPTKEFNTSALAHDENNSSVLNLETVLPALSTSFVTCDKSRIHETRSEDKINSKTGSGTNSLKSVGVHLGGHHCYCHQPLPDTAHPLRSQDSDERLHSSEDEMDEEFMADLSPRQSNNLKERKRRARIKKACEKMRHLVPGMSKKTDKATVFEFSARYIRFLKTFVDKDKDKDFLMRNSQYR